MLPSTWGSLNVDAAVLGIPLGSWNVAVPGLIALLMDGVIHILPVRGSISRITSPATSTYKAHEPRSRMAKSV